MVVETMYLGTKDILRCKGAHTKVHSGEMLDLGSRPRWFWICSGCLETGSDPHPEGMAPPFDVESYWRLMRELNPNCWVPETFRRGRL